MDDKVIELSRDMMRVTTREQIKTGDTWKPFTLLYEQLIRDELITPLSQLEDDKKRKYWNETSGSLFRRKAVCQALYVYDLMLQ